MTPEEARALEPGTTPGPWEWREHRPRSSDRHYDSLGPQGDNHALESDDAEQYASWIVGSDEDKALIAAAPDMRATIAALRWEYGVEQDNVTCNHIEHGADPTRCRFVTWCPDENTARIAADMPHRADRHPRIVRRLVSAIEETP